MGGFSYNQYNAAGIVVDNAPTFAASLVYDLTDWGRSRPFFEVGGGLTPYSEKRYSRYYANGISTEFESKRGRIRAHGVGCGPDASRRSGRLRRHKPQLDANGRIH